MCQPRTLLLPVVVDETGLDALAFAIDFAKQFDSALHLWFVNTPQAGYRHPATSVDDLKERVAAHASAGGLAELSVEYAVSRGDLGTETHRYCEEHGVDLLITTHERHTRIYTSLLDTRDEEIIESVDVPVLVLSQEFLK
jgi:nucleotide-binding universal stress UspA family protein